MSLKTYEAAVFGAVSVDAFPPVGEVTQPGYVAGEKEDLPDASPGAIRKLFERAEELHPGGNGPNAGEYIGRQPECARATLNTVIGERGDVVSDQARLFLSRSALDTSTVITAAGHRVSTGRIERGLTAEGYVDDRMVWGLGRGKMNGHMSSEYIERSTDTDLVLVASMKEADLTDRIFAATPEDAFLSYNPGSSEFKSHPDILRELMLQYRPDLLALNKEELAQLIEAPKDTPLEELLAASRGLAKHILATDAMKPVMLQTPDGLYRRAVDRVDRRLVVSTLGAGDRSHGVAAHGLMVGQHPYDILRTITTSTAQLVQHTGAHSDLTPKGV